MSAPIPSGFKTREEYNEYMKGYRKRKKAEAEITQPLVDAAVKEGCHGSFTANNPLKQAQERCQELEDLQRSVIGYIDEHKRLKTENTNLKAKLGTGIPSDSAAVQKRLKEILDAPVSTLEKMRRLVTPGEPEFDVTTLQGAINPLIDQMEVERFSHNMLAPSPESKIMQSINFALKEGAQLEAQDRLLRSLEQPLFVDRKQARTWLLQTNGKRR